jgi:hypothetical protein
MNKIGSNPVVPHQGAATRCTVIAIHDSILGVIQEIDDALQWLISSCRGSASTNNAHRTFHVLLMTCDSWRIPAVILTVCLVVNGNVGRSGAQGRRRSRMNCGRAKSNVRVYILLILHSRIALFPGGTRVGSLGSRSLRKMAATSIHTRVTIWLGRRRQVPYRSFW